MASSDSERAWSRARVLNDAGIISHYVADASQPHHTTIHFNGWAEGAPNPRGFTTDREFHSRFESGFVRSHLTQADLEPFMPSAPRRLENVRDAVWDYIRATNATVEELYQLEQDYGFDPAAPGNPETISFTAGRLATGAAMLADVWWTAWLDSAEIADGLRRREWDR
jgi:hypothetical protein